MNTKSIVSVALLLLCSSPMTWAQVGKKDIRSRAWNGPKLPDAIVRQNMNFEEFENFIYALEDSNGDGILQIYLREGIVISNPAGNPRSGILTRTLWDLPVHIHGQGTGATIENLDISSELGYGGTINNDFLTSLELSNLTLRSLADYAWSINLAYAPYCNLVDLTIVNSGMFTLGIMIAEDVHVKRMENVQIFGAREESPFLSSSVGIATFAFDTNPRIDSMKNIFIQAETGMDLRGNCEFALSRIKAMENIQLDLQGDYCFGIRLERVRVDSMKDIDISMTRTGEFLEGTQNYAIEATAQSQIAQIQNYTLIANGPGFVGISGFSYPSSACPSSPDTWIGQVQNMDLFFQSGAGWGFQLRDGFTMDVLQDFTIQSSDSTGDFIGIRTLPGSFLDQVSNGDIDPGSGLCYEASPGTLGNPEAFDAICQ